MDLFLWLTIFMINYFMDLSFYETTILWTNHFMTTNNVKSIYVGAGKLAPIFLWISFYGIIFLWYYLFMVLSFYGFIFLWFYLFMVLSFYGIIFLWITILLIIFFMNKPLLYARKYIFAQPFYELHFMNCILWIAF